MPTSTSFRIRIVGGLSMLFADGMSFDILDVTNNLLCVYDYRGISLSISTPVSISTAGGWNSFSTRVPMDVGDFGGIARFMSAGVENASITGFELQPLGKPPISIMPFSTGFTIGAGAGLGTGIFSRMFPPVNAAQAPFPHRP